MNKREKILIIKAGYSEFLEGETDSRKVSLGDVLRVTPLLNIYKNDYVTWVTDESAFPLLVNNNYIHRLLKLDWITANHLKKERFDSLINLEKVPGICSFSDDIYSVRRFGFRFDPEQRKAEAYDNAYEPLVVSSSPELKKSNKKTVQELLFEMIGKKWREEEYILGYSPKSKEKYDIALNTQVGQKWPTKAWPIKNWDILEKRLKKEYKVTRQDKQDKKILNNLNDYIDWINSSKLIVTNDSLGLHLAIALKKKVLGIFGSTPAKEVYFYGRGKAILPFGNFDCAPCFEKECKNNEFCLDYISPDKVYKEIKKIL